MSNTLRHLQRQVSQVSLPSSRSAHVMLNKNVYTASCRNEQDTVCRNGGVNDRYAATMSSTLWLAVSRLKTHYTTQNVKVHLLHRSLNLRAGYPLSWSSCIKQFKRIMMKDITFPKSNHSTVYSYCASLFTVISSTWHL